MRYRQLSPSGDYVFGNGATFLVNTPATVAQAISTRLKLFAGDWFLDRRIGLDMNQILGYNTQGTRDFEVKQRILGTSGVKSLLQYASTVQDRVFTVVALVDTIYGVVPLTETF